MPDAVTISPAAPGNRGLDYAWLKQEGTRLVQQLAGTIWTDYNEHDPGVTTLEQICYALTDLSFRAEFPLRDFLAGKTGRIDTRKQALFVPRRILPCNPVTVNDYRKLLVDRCEGVANVWMVARRPVSNVEVDGLYDILIYAPGADPCACNEDLQPDAVRERVAAVYGRHRNLCEDVRAIDIVEPVKTRVAARVTIDESRTPEFILASLLFNIGSHLAPELRRRPLAELVAAGVATDMIFNGPLLRHGFIADSELEPKAAEIAVAGIVRVMAQTPGVIGLGNVAAYVGEGHVPYATRSSIPVPPNKVLQLDHRSTQNGLSIRLWRKGIEIKPDPMRVQRELDRIWSDYRRTFSLTAQYQQDFAVPEGRPRDLATYYSLQNQYPNAYGINSWGLPDDAGPVRKAQAKQLKGYLLAFEQVLADFFAQLAHVKDLYSIEKDLARTIFYQSLSGSVPNVGPLLRSDYLDGLSRIVAGQDAVVERRNRFLDVLLALYGERLDETMVAGADATSDDAGTRMLRAKLALLHALVTGTRNRGRGFDYRAALSPRNMAGMLVKSRIQLGMDPLDLRPRGDLLAEWALELVDDDAIASIGRPLSGHADHIDEYFATPEIDGVSVSMQASPLQAAPLQGQRVTEDFLHAAADVDNFRVGRLPDEADVLVVLRPQTGGLWSFVGRYPDHDVAHAFVARLTAQAGRLGRHARQLYVVEHTLLRFGRDRSGHDDHRERPGDVQAPPAFVYDFTVSAVTSRPDDRDGSADDGTFLREVVRSNVPAHIAVDYCFLQPRSMRRFERRYAAWQQALRRGDREQIAEASARLQQFLHDHRGDPSARSEDGRNDR